MKRWRSIDRALAFTLILGAGTLIGCTQTAPTPTPKPTVAPTLVAAATEPPTMTPLPPPPTASVATDTPAPTNTSAPTDTPMPTATVTRTRAPVTPKPKASPTNTAVALKYPPPDLIEPGSKDTRIEGKDALEFKWKPIADFGTDECYQVTVRIINLNDPTQRYGQASYLAQNTCNSAVSSGTLKFTLYPKRLGQPDYEGLVGIASQITPSNVYQVRWWVTVVRNDGTPLSPPSAQFEFRLNSP